MIQGNDSFRLVVRRGPQPNQPYELNKDVVTLGRDITNDIVINDPEVSRHHLRLTRSAGGFILEDLGSTNGTFVNGQRLTGQRPLRPGDKLGLGETVTLDYEATASANPTISQQVDGPPAGTMLSAAQRGASMPVQPQSQPVQPAQPSQPYAPPQPSQPYAPPAGASQPANPYAPPQGYPPPGASQGMPPAGASQGVPPQQSGYSYSPTQNPYGQQSAGYSGGANSQPYAAPSMGMPPAVPPGSTGYGEYDPYAVREEGQNNTARIILIGCGALSVICCCSSIIGAVIVDQTCSWASLPIVYPLLQALGYVAVCP